MGLNHPPLSPRTACRVVLGGSVRLVRLRYRVCYQAPDGRLLRSAAGCGVPRPFPLVGEV